MSRTKKQPEVQSQLARALSFLNLTYKVNDQGVYCMMHEHQARSFNLTIAAGTTIEEDLTACPQMDLMLEAIARCLDNYVITQLSPGKLLVRSEEFQAYIPCADPKTLSWPDPDAPVAPVGNALIDALREVAPLLTATGETLVEQSIQLNAGSCIATDRHVILEAWHGFDLPNGLLLPKAIVTALHKSGKKLRSFGYSTKTATFWFDDGSWLRTQLFQEKWPPKVTEYLQVSPTLRKVPEYLFEAAKKVGPFSENGAVYIKDELISSHPFGAIEVGSRLELPIGSYHAERIYPIACLKIAAKYAVLWDETARKDGTYFEGNKVRGLISHIIAREEMDDDIPF